MTAKKLKLTHPGKMLREEFMEPVGLSAYALAKALDVPLPRVNQFVRRFIQARLKINQPGMCTSRKQTAWRTK
jgi:plasmid maintenance system antidote protein VapI